MSCLPEDGSLGVETYVRRLWTVSNLPNGVPSWMSTHMLGTHQIDSSDVKIVDSVRGIEWGVGGSGSDDIRPVTQQGETVVCSDILVDLFSTLSSENEW